LKDIKTYPSTSKLSKDEGEVIGVESSSKNS